MAKTLQWSVAPKVIDANDNETALDSYTVTTSYADLVDLEIIIGAADTAAKTMPKPAGSIYAIEMVSNQPVTVTITGPITVTALSTRNLFINTGTATGLTTSFVMTVTNNSGYEATVNWRVLGTAV